MSYIAYPQVEILLKNYRQLLGSLKAWKLKFEKDLLKTNEDGAFTPDEILYTRFVGNHLLSDMPFGGHREPGDKVISAILAKDKIVEETPDQKVQITMRPLAKSIIAVAEILTRLEIARESLPDQEQEIIEMFYYRGLTWKEVVELGKYCIEVKQARNIRRDAIEMMVKKLQDPKDPITMEQFDFCMGQMEWKGGIIVNRQEKIDLINTLPVIDYDADGEVCHYVNVLFDDNTQRVLKQLGKDELWINANAEDAGDGEQYIDISAVGFEFAKWWHSDTGFSLHKTRD